MGQSWRPCRPVRSGWTWRNTIMTGGDAICRAAGKKETDFVDIVAWRSTADFVSKFFTKGRMAVVEGRLQLRDWKDKDGNNRRSAEVVAEHVYFGDSKQRSESDTPSASGDFREISEDEEGELPF